MSDAKHGSDGPNGKTLVFTVTPGRSGTGLLATLLGRSAGIDAAHEPSPRINFVFRSFQACPDTAAGWLQTEKLPAIQQRSGGPIYVETSHLVCKCLIETLLNIGLDLKFIFLSRPIREVATSLYQINAIPERTSAGRLVLLGPSDRGVLRISSWDELSDYQLCYWYVREIERRQVYYKAVFDERRIAYRSITMNELTDWKSFSRLCYFLTDDDQRPLNRSEFDAVVARDQNPRAGIRPSMDWNVIPPDIRDQESTVDELLRDQAGTLTLA